MGSVQQYIHVHFYINRTRAYIFNSAASSRTHYTKRRLQWSRLVPRTCFQKHALRGAREWWDRRVQGKDCKDGNIDKEIDLHVNKNVDALAHKRRRVG